MSDANTTYRQRLIDIITNYAGDVDISIFDTLDISNLMNTPSIFYEYILNLNRHRSITRKHNHVLCRPACPLTELECNITGFFVIYRYLITEYNDEDPTKEIHKPHIPVEIRDVQLKLPVRYVSKYTRVCISNIRYQYTQGVLNILGFLPYFESFKYFNSSLPKKDRVFLMCYHFYPDVWHTIEYFIKNNSIENSITLDTYILTVNESNRTERDIINFYFNSNNNNQTRNNVSSYMTQPSIKSYFTTNKK